MSPTRRDAGPHAYEVCANMGRRGAPEHGICDEPWERQTCANKHISRTISLSHTRNLVNGAKSMRLITLVALCVNRPFIGLHSTSYTIGISIYYVTLDVLRSLNFDFDFFLLSVVAVLPIGLHICPAIIYLLRAYFSRSSFPPHSNRSVAVSLAHRQVRMAPTITAARQTAQKPRLLPLAKYRTQTMVNIPAAFAPCFAHGLLSVALCCAFLRLQ